MFSIVALAWFVALAVVESAFFPDPLPAYCNADYASTAIDPLTEAELSQVSELKQVLVMIRHGSRTPYAAGLACWEDYNIQWKNCNVTDLVLPSDALYNYTSQSRPDPWLFRLIYDAWPDELGGNCMTGQLMHEGYMQEMANGIALRAAYLNQTNSSLNIFDTDIYSDLDSSRMYFRSDDEQRTVMSGQIMLSAFFNSTSPSIVAWHTMDDAIDEIAPNANACPALNDASAAAYSSDEFVSSVNSSTTLQPLINQLNAVWGEGAWNFYNCIDCVMTTVCTGRGIPPNSETGAEMNSTLFNEAIAQATKVYAYQALYNDSRYSKLGMGRVVYNLRTHLQAAVSNQNKYAKFGLWSAHDTSIMPLLAALMGPSWDQQWARYAAMVTIELYSATATSSVGAGGHYFRLTYNGQALSMPGCNNATLCDINILLGLMAFGEVNMPCAAGTNTDNSDSSSSSSASSIYTGSLAGLNFTEWLIMCGLSSVLGVILGAVLWNNFVTHGRKTGTYCGVGQKEPTEVGDLDNSAKPMKEEDFWRENSGYLTTSASASAGGGGGVGVGNPMMTTDSVGGEDVVEKRSRGTISGVTTEADPIPSRSSNIA